MSMLYDHESRAYVVGGHRRWNAKLVPTDADSPEIYDKQQILFNVDEFRHTST